jgi:squalene synthase HpnC
MHVIVCIELRITGKIEIMTREGRTAATALPAPGPAPDRDVPVSAAGQQLGAVAAKAAAENFPVALRLLPARYRRHLMAVYCFARAVDDAGDLAPAPQRAQLLCDLADDVRRLYQEPRSAADAPRLPVVQGLADTVAECGIGMQPLLDLIGAGQQDQAVTRYQTFDELIGYCRLSANPVGYLVLHVFGSFTPERGRLSDSICTGLQVVEHLQDVGEDMRAGRIYLPAEDMRAYGCAEDDLLRGSAPPRLRQLIAHEADRARSLLDAGAPLIGSLHGAARVAVAGYLAGGRAALAAIAAADHDVLSATRRPGKGRTVAELALVYWRGR